MNNHILPGAIHLFPNGRLNQKQTKQFLRCAHRAECGMNPVVYCKAIRASLMALGFDVDWVEDEFREKLEEEYLY